MLHSKKLMVSYFHFIVCIVRYFTAGDTFTGPKLLPYKGMRHP